jgi:hypothetical protein
VGLENLTDAIKMVLYAWFLHICSEKIQFAKILSVLSKENPYVFVKWEIKKPKSQQFVVQIKVVVQYSLKNWAILAIYSPGKMFLTPKMVH